MTVQEALARGTAQLVQAGIEGAARDARLLIAAALGLGADRVTLHLRDDLEPEAGARYDALLARRLAHVPVSHLVGGRMFYGRWFEVNGDVLDPRPETESLVVAALAEPFARVLDLGVGSGAILLTLLAERGDATGVGSDMSAAALAVAGRNAASLAVAARCDLVQSDWFASVTGEFDLIVSNPPYIAAAEMAALAPELGYEPRMALTDGADGLSAYRAIAAGAGRHLAAGGRVLVETGWQQAADVVEIFKASGLHDIGVLADLDGRDRVVSARFRP